MGTNLGINFNLLINNVKQGDDVFIHGFRLDEKQNIEDFSKILFNEGIKKQPRTSILSTIALLRHNKPISEQISNYVLHGKYRVILKIPESLDDLFLGKCKKKYGDAGNQYSENSVLDFFESDHIPPEFIVGIVYTDKEMYNDGENIEYNFIQNPNYFDHIELGKQNSEKLVNKLKNDINKDNDFKSYILKHLLLGEEIKQDIIDFLKQYNLIERYEEFINQRAEFDNSKENNQTI